MIGGGILAAWIPFWHFVSTLSTVDFMSTSSGRPSVGSFFLPRGIAEGMTVLGIGVMVYAFIKSARPTEVVNSIPDTQTQCDVSSEAERQWSSLTLLEQIALRACTAKYGMTDTQLADYLESNGLPRRTDIFSMIANKTTLLGRDETMGQWAVKPDFLNDIRHLSQRPIVP